MTFCIKGPFGARVNSKLSYEILYILNCICDISAFLGQPDQFYSPLFLKLDQTQFFQSLQNLHCVAICAINFLSQNTPIPHSYILLQRDQHQSRLSPEKDIKVVFHRVLSFGYGYFNVYIQKVLSF